jgi:DNA-binding MarR family transcriptional regulator
VQATDLQFGEKSLSFVQRAIIRIVLADLLKDESGAMALQHVGILWIIYAYSEAQDPITTARLNELTKTTPTAIIKYTERLERLGLIKRKRVTASHGRGRAWQYHPALPQDILTNAVKAILEAGTTFPSLAAFADSVLPPRPPSAPAAISMKLERPRKSVHNTMPNAERKPRKRKPD